MATYDVNALLSATAYGSDGDKIGKVQQVFLDDNTEEVTFVTVNTGLFGSKETFVPADGAQQDGDRLVLPYTKDVVKDAPNVDADQHLSPAEEEELYRYYKMNYADAGRTGDADYVGTGTTGTTGRTGDADYVGTGTTGRTDYDTVDTDRNAVPAAGTAGVAAGTGRTADTDDDAIIRREERLNVGKQQQEAGRARLRKYVVTEHQTVDVPVTREEVRVERTPLSATEAAGGTIGGDETVEVTLHEERAVVDKDTVGVEKIELDKQAVTETQQVEADVRKEQVEVETDVDRDGRDRR